MNIISELCRHMVKRTNSTSTVKCPKCGGLSEPITKHCRRTEKNKDNYYCCNPSCDMPTFDIELHVSYPYLEGAYQPVWERQQYQRERVRGGL